MLQTLALVIALLVPLAAAVVMGISGRGWFYAGVWIIFYPIFGLMEFLSVKFRKKTISKDIASLPSFQFWFIVASWFVLAGGLSLHWYIMR